MFSHMVPIKKAHHSARGNDYELFVYQVQESGEYRIYISKSGFGVGDIFTATQEIVHDVQQVAGHDIVENLLCTAKCDIDRNEFGLY